jgi:ferredoxin
MRAANTILIDGRALPIEPGQSVLEVARAAGMDIPTLCYLEKCGPLNTCQVCLVKVDGKLVPSCGTKVRPGLVVESETEEVREARRTALELLFSDHVGDCLAPCQRLCPLGMNIPGLLRQMQRSETAQAVQTVRSALPLAGVLGRLCHHPCEQGCRRGHWDSPATIRDIERHVSGLEADSGRLGFSKPRDGARKVAVVGAGPAGLSGAWHLLRQGHAVTVFDRNPQCGGKLRETPEDQLPSSALDIEIEHIRAMGARFETGRELGGNLSMGDLLAAFDAVLIACGELDETFINGAGLPVGGTFLKTDPQTSQTPVSKVFGTGAAVRPTRQLVRVMAEAKAAAECVHRFLSGKISAPAPRPFSSVMGRVSPGEIKSFLAHASKAASVLPCDKCAGLNKTEAKSEAERCLHCDCRSSGNCVLQHYAQAYNADASRFRSERRPFEQFVQPGGVIFEPGKCILCGICVKLTEMAAEPLGLTFIGRGFDVRVSAPLNRAIEEGLQITAAECVEHCPTGALAFR